MEQNLKRICSGLDIRPLQVALNCYPALWKEFTARQYTPGSAHKDTETIFLLWAEAQTIEAVFNEIKAVTYPALTKLFEANDLIIKAAMKILDNGTMPAIGRVIITKLKPGGIIDAHIDEGAYADHYERFHVILDSDEGNVFFVEDEPGHGEYAHMRPGELWWFNHKKKHWVCNNSGTDRIHLIIDAVVPAYRRERDQIPA